MNDEQTLLLRQIRNRLTLIAVAVVVLASLVAIPYLLAALTVVVASLSGPSAWLVVIGAMLLAFTIMMAVVVFAENRKDQRGFEPVISAKPVDP